MRVHAAEEDRVRALALDGRQDGHEVGGLVGRVLLVDDLHALGHRGLLEHLGHALAVGAAVVDDRDLLELQAVSGIQRQTGAQRVVVGQQPERGFEALLGQLGVGRRRRDVGNAAVVVDLGRRNGGARVQVADDAVDLGVAQLLRCRGALLGVGRIVFSDELELHFLATDGHALGVQILDGHARTVLVVLAVVRLRTRDGTDVADAHDHFLGRRSAGERDCCRAHQHIQFDLHA